MGKRIHDDFHRALRRIIRLKDDSKSPVNPLSGISFYLRGMKRTVICLFAILFTFLTSVEAGKKICDPELRSASSNKNQCDKQEEAAIFASANTFGIGVKTENTGLDSSPAPIKILHKTIGFGSFYRENLEYRFQAEFQHYQSIHKKLSFRLSSPNKVYPFHSYW